jgi:hypothetical protein
VDANAFCPAFEKVFIEGATRLVVDSVSNSRGRLRYSEALIMAMFMVIGSFRAVSRKEAERKRTRLIPLRESGLATNGGVRESLGKPLKAEISIPLGGESFMLPAQPQQSDVTALHDGAGELLDAQIARRNGEGCTHPRSDSLESIDLRKFGGDHILGGQFRTLSIETVSMVLWRLRKI